MKKLIVGAVGAMMALVVHGGYTPLSYLEATGAQWIHTGYTPKATDRVETRARFSKLGGYPYVFCSRGKGNRGTDNAFTCLLVEGGKLRLHHDVAYGAQSIAKSPSLCAVDVDFTLVVDGATGDCKFNHATMALDNPLSIGNITPEGPFVLFNSYSNGVDQKEDSTVDPYFMSGRLYYFRVYDAEGKLVRDFIPVRDDSAAEGSAKRYGMFETVTGVFHPNCGSAAFVPGPDAGPEPHRMQRFLSVGDSATVGGTTTVTLTFTNPGYPQRLFMASGANDGGDAPDGWEKSVPLADVGAWEMSRKVALPAGAKFVRFFAQPALPEGAKMLTSLSSSGTQYVKTGFYPDGNSRAEARFRYPRIPPKDTFYCPFGSRNGGASTFFFICSSRGDAWGLFFGGGYDDIWNYDLPVVGDHAAVMDRNVYAIDGVSRTLPVWSFDPDYECYVFAHNNNGTAGNYGVIDFYSLALWDDGDLSRAYVPCKKADGTPALYDSVTGRFDVNEGSGELTCGAEVWSSTDTLQPQTSAPVRAEWTGGGVRNDFTDTANWRCYNGLEAVMPGELPTEETDVYFTQTIDFDLANAAARTQLDAYKSCHFASSLALETDCDWSGVTANDPIFSELKTLDLNGRDFTFPGVNGTTTNAFALTDTSAEGGTLVLDVPESATFENTLIQIGGSLGLRKVGKGVYSLSCDGQTYAGGTRVDGGTLQFGKDNATIGASGSEVTVGPGATLELNGKRDFYRNSIVLAGGTLQNTTGLDIGSGAAQLANVRLTANSTMRAVNSFGFVGSKYAATALDLGGYELTVDIAADKSFWFDNVAVSAGKLKATGAGAFAIAETSMRGAEADFDLACATVTAAVPCDVGGWIVGADTAVSGAGTVTIRGTYRPLGDSVSKYVLADGATLDLSNRNAAFDLTDKDVAFTAGSAFKVDAGERELKPEDKLISWPGAATGVSFTLVNPLSDADNLLVRADGLYYCTTPAYATINPSSGSWSFFTASGAEHSGWKGGVTSDIEVRFSSKAEFDAIKAAGVTPSRYVLTGLELTEDTDLSQGLGFTTAPKVTIDLKGHRLSLPAKTLESSAGITITDTNEDGYDILSYIKTDGTQWIDTKLTPAWDDRIETKVNFNEISGYQAIWCSRMQGGKKAVAAFMCYDAHPPFRFDRPDVASSSLGPTTATPNTDYLIVANGGTRDLSINGMFCAQALKGSEDVKGRMTLFVANELTDAGAMIGLSSYGKLKCHYFRMFASDGALKLDLVPARRLSDGKVGMLDRVTNVFYQNNGTGDFTAGEAVGRVGATGELHVNVPAGETASVGQNTLTGRLKFVKDGEGALVPDGTLTYWGGTRIDGGMVLVPANDMTIGAAGSEVEVASGATLEMNGKYHFHQNVIVLAGGTLQNATGMDVAEFYQVENVRLTADSTMRIANDFGIIGSGYGVATLDLGDNELTVDVAKDKRFFFYNVSVTSGKLTVTGEGTFAIDKTALRGAEADFNLACAKVSAAVPCYVGGWTVGANTAVSGGGTVTIRGTYRPLGDAVSKYVLADGATLDLSGRSTAFDITDKNVSFANDAKIFVNPPQRKGGLIVPWTTPANLATLTFEKVPEADGILSVDGQGISIRRGMMILVR